MKEITIRIFDTEEELNNNLKEITDTFTNDGTSDNLPSNSIFYTKKVFDKMSGDGFKNSIINILKDRKDEDDDED